MIDSIVKQSDYLPRPENTIARKKSHLWNVPIEDKIVQNAKRKISETINDNLKVLKHALNVYNDYLFILTEQERVEESLKQDHFDRNQF